jgi:ParB family transcriptional regulator, chromosome partitioning protein
MLVEAMPVDGIVVGKRFRQVDQEWANALAQSISTVGLRTPITVRILPEILGADGVALQDVPVLVAGLHRLEAVKLLGWEDIDAFVVAGDDKDARLWEIAENLHRKDLTAQERAEQVAEWVKITEDKDQSAQVAPIESKRSDGRGHRKAGGINAAVRDLGIERTEAQRSMKIASMEPEAKEAARQHGLDDNQKALLAVAKAPPDQQVAKVQEIVDQKAAKKAADKDQPAADIQPANPPPPPSRPAEKDVVDLAIDAILLAFKIPQFQQLQEKITGLPGSLERRLLDLSFS